MPGGRPRHLTRALREEILTAILEGNHPLVAARAAGVPAATWYKWLKEGREARDAEEAGETPPATTLPLDLEAVDLAEFLDAVDRAEALSERFLVQHLQRAASGSGRGAMAAGFLIERRFPHRWRERKTLEVEGAEPTPFAMMSDEELAAEGERILKTIGSKEAPHGDPTPAPG